MDTTTANKDENIKDSTTTKAAAEKTIDNDKKSEKKITDSKTKKSN